MLKNKIESLEKKLNLLLDNDVINKIDEFNKNVEKVKELEIKCTEDIDWSKEPLLLNAKDLKRILGVYDVYQLFHREDFPKIVMGKRYLTPRKEFRKWLEKEAWKAE